MAVIPAAGTVLSVGENTVNIPVLVSTMPSEFLLLPINFILVEANGITNIGNEDIAVAIAECLFVTEVCPTCMKVILTKIN